MLKEASLSELRSKGIPRERRVLVNRGRGNDELAPSDGLFGDFMSRKREREHEFGVGSAEAHNAAFVDCDYEQRFRAQIAADAAAQARIAEVAERGTCEDVYLVCYEGPSKACHRRILLRIAAETHGAAVSVDGIEPG